MDCTGFSWFAALAVFLNSTPSLRAGTMSQIKGNVCCCPSRCHRGSEGWVCAPLWGSAQPSLPCLMGSRADHIPKKMRKEGNDHPSTSCCAELNIILYAYCLLQKIETNGKQENNTAATFTLAAECSGGYLSLGSRDCSI